MCFAFHRCLHLVLLRWPRAGQGPLPIGLWLGDGWDGSREEESIERYRQVIASGGQAGQALHAHLPFPDGERGNARAQCSRDDPRDRLSFPSKDGLLNRGRGGSQSSSTANLAQPSMWHSGVLLYFVTTSSTAAFPVL